MKSCTKWPPTISCEAPVLASKRAHHIGCVADVLEPETVGKVGREARSRSVMQTSLLW
jgi:hypothetical protein